MHRYTLEEYGLDEGEIRRDFGDGSRTNDTADPARTEKGLPIGKKPPLPKQSLRGQAAQIRPSAAAREENASISDILIPLRRATGSRKPPLFCIHPGGGGSIMRYRELVDCLPEDQPVYGIQPVGFEGEAEPLTDVHAMAARYVKEITALWPAGPYNLYGWSFGGVIAFEMARLLRSDNRAVALLALGDSPAPAPAEARPIEPKEEAILFNILIQMGNGQSTSYDELQDMTPADRLAYLRERITAERLDSLVDHFVRITLANRQAYRSYQPASPWEGRLVLLVATGRTQLLDMEGQHFRIKLGPWEGLARQVDRHVVPGDHFTMHRQPNVREIAEVLKKYLGT
ncbi:MAG: Thioesterase domain-containing protein [Candidatus Kentron sp. G]|nr:MAG: Thioesterase domain-containing protein [Candidatus Kentron sp. G]